MSDKSSDVQAFIASEEKKVREPLLQAFQRLAEAAREAGRLTVRSVDGHEFQRSILAQIPLIVDPDAPPLKPPVTVLDVFYHRLSRPHPDYIDPVTDITIDQDVHQGRHALQSAAYAMASGWSEEVIVASFLHDFGKLIRRQKHAYLAAEMFKPYTSEKIYYLINNHFDVIAVLQPDAERVAASGRVHPSPNVREAWFNRQAFDAGPRDPNRLNLDLDSMVQGPWSKELAQVREADDEGRIPHYTPDIMDELRPILDRHIKVPRAGLGTDGSSAEGLWQLVIEGTWMT